MSGVNYQSVNFSMIQDTVQVLYPVNDTVGIRRSEELQNDTTGTQQKNESSVSSSLKTKIKTDSSGILVRKTILSATKNITEAPKINLPVNEVKIIPENIIKPAWKSYSDFNTFLYQNTINYLSDGYADSAYLNVLPLKEKTPDFISRTNFNLDWIFWTFILLSLLFVWIQVFYRRYVINLFNAAVSFQASTKLFNEKNLNIIRVSAALNFIYVISLSLVIFRLTRYFNIRPENYENLSFFLLILNFMILYSVLKAVIVKITGYVFFQHNLINEYSHNAFVYNKNLGIVILPIIFASFYTAVDITEILLVIVVVIYIFSLFFKLIRSFQIIIKYDIFIFYSILYLCTLEFLPVLIGYKFIKSLD